MAQKAETFLESVRRGVQNLDVGTPNIEEVNEEQLREEVQLLDEQTERKRRLVEQKRKRMQELQTLEMEEQVIKLKIRKMIEEITVRMDDECLSLSTGVNSVSI